MHHQPALVRWSMPMLVASMLILCCLPSPWLSWTSWFGAQARVVVSPIAHPITMARDFVLPRSVSDPKASERERSLMDELDRYRTLLYRERAQNERLEAMVNELSSGAALTPDVAVDQFERPVVGTAREFLIVRTGTAAERVTRSSVVVVDAVQLAGRVSDSRDRTCLVLPINAPSAQPIMGAVLLDDSGTKTARCLLRPVGDGSLKGDVTQPSDDAREIEVGMEVRLLDDQWPRHAQMLVLGTIERVTRSPSQPLRRQIVVRPRVDLRSSSHVVFRVPKYEDEGGNP